MNKIKLNKRITYFVIAASFTLIGCISALDNDLEVEKYEVINFVVNEAEIGWKKAPLPRANLYMDSLFIGVSHSQYSADPKNHDTIILNTLARRLEAKCPEALPIFKIKDTEYVWSQINKEGSKINFSKITSKNAVPYKLELEDPESTAFLQKYKAKKGTLLKGVKLVDDKYLEGIKGQLLFKENGYFELSSPVFSKDRKTALIIVNYPSLGDGGYAWIVEKKEGEWQKVCDSRLWHY